MRFEGMIRLTESLKQSGAVSRDELESTTGDIPMDPEHRAEMESIVLSLTPSMHKFYEKGRHCIVYFDKSGRAVSSAVSDIPGGELVRLAQMRGWVPSGSNGYVKPEEE